MELISQAVYQQQVLQSKETSPQRTLLQNCRLPLNEDAASGLHDIVVEGIAVTAISPSSAPDKANFTQSHDLKGAYVIPGLCDAHVHVTACTANLPGLLSMPESLVAARAARELNDMLLRGFTTVRDAGGADFGLAQAVDEGAIVGPRLLFVGHALSQTGGHGDMRAKGEDCVACGAALRGIGAVCDGDMEVRRAARDELRKGAHCIKIMASGGVSSPTDRLTNTQFSKQELRAIVEEAEACGTYVCAHAYTSAAIARCVECGVRSIEHGNRLDAKTAELMKAKGAFLVPTLVTYQKLMSEGAGAGMAQDLVDKVGSLYEDGLEAMQLAHDLGITVCNGSDLLGDMRKHQAAELVICAQKLGAQGALKAATTSCAELFNMSGQVGKLAPGAFADLVVLDADPTQDINVIINPQSFIGVMRQGIWVCRHPAFFGLASA